METIYDGLSQFLWNLLNLFILYTALSWQLFCAPPFPDIFERKLRSLTLFTFWTIVECSYRCLFCSILSSNWLVWKGRHGSWPPLFIWNFQSNFASTNRTTKNILINTTIFPRIDFEIVVEFLRWSEQYQLSAVLYHCNICSASKTKAQRAACKYQ